MSAIEKIIAQINEQADAELTALEQEEKQRIDADYQAGLIRLMNEYEKQKDKQLTNLDSKYRQLSNRQQVEIRQETLNEKQQFLANLFQQAADQMEAWNETEVQNFAEAALRNIHVSGNLKFMAGEKSKNYFSREWLEEVTQQLPFTLESSNELISGQAGFVVDDEGVQYNFIFQNLIKDIQEQMAYEIASQLFE